MPHNHLNENWHPFDIDNEMWLSPSRSPSLSLSPCECGMGNSWWMRQEHLAQVQINYWTQKNQPTAPFPSFPSSPHLACPSLRLIEQAGSSSQNASTFTLCCPRLPSLRLPLSARLASRTIAAYFNLQLDFLTFLPDVPCALKACLLPRLCLGICDH